MPEQTHDTETIKALARIADALESLNDTIDDLEETINFSTVALLTDDSQLTLPVKWKRVKEGAKIPVRNGAAYDLFIPNDVEINAGETVRIHLGFAAKLPDGWHALINMRSSTWKRWGLCLTNQTGIIDNTYCGDNDEWILSVYRPNSFKDYPEHIPAGTRLTQFRLERDCPMLNFEEVDSLEDESRGGFGSTGL